MIKVIERQKVAKKDIWEEVKGMWNNKKPDPVKYLTQLRKEGKEFIKNDCC